ncbi:unannotated protein [freshwater metagenome]|uniref:Unannotated protein n=1 Tax=freshwater metagenome TaxID=449393 RepID=A0A6J7N3E9_9ZZZZ|nr:DUF4395 family protein [Actinomycetota bacterium]MSY31242.1 DUF4395 family protein [Actinomycetota bacterium]
MTQTTFQKTEKKNITIDARGPRFSALLTVVILSLAIYTESIWVLAIQTVVFAVGAIKGPQFTPYAYLFKKVIRPRLKGEAPKEDVRPPQFAQSVGLAFTIVALAGIIANIPLLFTISLGFALGAAFLNAAFNFCLGCEMYLLILRLK